MEVPIRIKKNNHVSKIPNPFAKDANFYVKATAIAILIAVGLFAVVGLGAFFAGPIAISTVASVLPFVALMSLPAFAAAAGGVAAAATMVVTGLVLGIRALVVAPWRQLILKLKLKYVMSGLDPQILTTYNTKASRKNGVSEDQAENAGFTNEQWGTVITSLESMCNLALEVLTENVRQELTKEADSSEEDSDSTLTTKTTTTRILKALDELPETQNVRTTIKNNLAATGNEEPNKVDRTSLLDRNESGMYNMLVSSKFFARMVKAADSPAVGLQQNK